MRLPAHRPAAHARPAGPLHLPLSDVGPLVAQITRRQQSVHSCPHSALSSVLHTQSSSRSLSTVRQNRQATEAGQLTHNKKMPAARKHTPPQIRPGSTVLRYCCAALPQSPQAAMHSSVGACLAAPGSTAAKHPAQSRGNMEGEASGCRQLRAVRLHRHAVSGLVAHLVVAPLCGVVCCCASGSESALRHRRASWYIYNVGYVICSRHCLRLAVPAEILLLARAS